MEKKEYLMDSASFTVDSWRKEYPLDTPILIRTIGGWNLHGLLKDLNIHTTNEQYIFYKEMLLKDEDIEHMELDGHTLREQTKELETTPWIKEQDPLLLFLLGTLIGIIGTATIILLFTLTA